MCDLVWAELGKSIEKLGSEKTPPTPRFQFGVRHAAVGLPQELSRTRWPRPS